MKTARCQRCKKMYEFDGLPPQYCAECFLIDEQEYSVVRNYIKEHKGATMTEVSLALGVSGAKIIQYLREERLEIMPSSSVTSFLKCAVCRKVINTGVYCETCKKRYNTSDTKVIAKVQMDGDSKMHIAQGKDEDKKK